MATSDSLAQDVITCDLCDKPTQQFCNSCQVSLCYTCVKKHREDFLSLSHDIVPFLDRKIQLVCPECQHHPGQRCEANCLQYSVPVCLKCIISGSHKGHEVEELFKANGDIKMKIEKDTEEIKTKLLPKLQRKNAEIQGLQCQTKTQFDDIRKESEKLRKLWHQEVDNIFDKIDSMSHGHREDKLNALQAYHTKIRKLISEINETVKQNEKLLKSNKMSEVSKYESKLKEYGDFPENIDLHMPTLVSKIDQGKELSIEIGDFRVILEQLPQTSLPAGASHLTKIAGELKEKGKVIATIPTFYETLLDFAFAGDVEAWIHGNGSTITRIDIHGTVKDRVTQYKYGPGGIALTRQGELIFSDGYSRTVNIVRQGKSETLISTPEDWVPRGLCRTRSGDILVPSTK